MQLHPPLCCICCVVSAVLYLLCCICYVVSAVLYLLCCICCVVSAFHSNKIQIQAIDINFMRDILIQDFIMVAILETADSESNLSRWGFRLLAKGIQCGPPDQTKKVLNLGNQQLSDLREDTNICGLLYRLIFHWV